MLKGLLVKSLEGNEGHVIGHQREGNPHYKVAENGQKCALPLSEKQYL